MPALLSALVTGPAVADGITHGSPVSLPASATVCEINRSNSQYLKGKRAVSITAAVSYDFEYGFALQDPRCMKGRDLANVHFLLRIAFRPGKSAWDDPELAKAGMQDWLKDAIGKYVYCTCVGTVSYAEGYPTFVLDHAERVWASSENLLK